MNSRLLIVVDTETTGLSPADGCVWDLAGVALRDGEIIGEFETLVRPCADRFQRPQREVVQRISGLDDAGLLRLFDAPSVRQAEASFCAWWRALAADCPVTFTSFNAAFDAKFLIQDPWELGYATWGPCVMEACCEPMGQAGLLTRTRYGDRWLWPKLVNAARYFDVPFEETHRALADARAAAAIALKLGLDAQPTPATLTLDL